MGISPGNRRLPGRAGKSEAAGAAPRPRGCVPARIYCPPEAEVKGGGAAAAAFLGGVLGCERGAWALTIGGMAAARCFSCFRSRGFWGEALALVSLVGVRRLGRGDSSLRERRASARGLTAGLSWLQPRTTGAGGAARREANVQGHPAQETHQDSGGGERGQMTPRSLLGSSLLREEPRALPAPARRRRPADPPLRPAEASEVPGKPRRGPEPHSALRKLQKSRKIN